MPDIFSVIARRWKWMLLLAMLASAGALLACLLSPKKYLSVVTAIPSNSLVGDKARLFNQNIEALYTELGSPDELDRMEGTAKLDTLFLAAAKAFNLPTHYAIDQPDTAGLYKAASVLEKNTKVNRTAYGELQLQVWDKDKYMAAALANAMLQSLNEIHQQLRTENNRAVLQRLKETYAQHQSADSHATVAPGDNLPLRQDHYARLINEYELALKTAPKPLLVVEPARPSLKADKPRTLLTVVLTFAASLLFTFLLALLAESRQRTA